MDNKEEHVSSSAAASIKLRIQRLNWIIVLIIFLVLLLTVRYLYAFLDYIPLGSTVTLMSVIAGLSVASYFLAKSTSSNALAAMEEYSRKIKALLVTTKNIQKIGYSDILLEDILDISMEMARADGGSLVLVEGEKLVFKTTKGGRSEIVKGLTIPKSKGIVGWVVDKGVTLRANDVKNDSRFLSTVDKMTGYETRSVLCVPLILGSETIGALELVSGTPGMFKFDDEEIMVYFADQASLSFERAMFREADKNYKIHLTNILVESIETIAGKPGHSRRVAKYTLLMAHAMKLAEGERERLYRAAMLLDIGFLKINMHGVSTADEYKEHAKLGYEMLQPIEFYSDIAGIILHHHERFDGNGYPAGLKGNAILLESRILAVAEAFDAMVSRYSYKNVGKVINKEVNPFIVRFGDAINELKKEAGKQFDPKVVEAFVNTITEEDLG
jgi:GAF domain-containing protein